MKLNKVVTKLKSFVRFLISLCFLFMAGCRMQSEVYLINKGHTQIEKIKVLASEKLIWEGELGAGEAVEINFNANKDGSLKMFGQYDGKLFETDDLGYITPNDGVFHRITFEDKNTILYDYSTTKQ